MLRMGRWPCCYFFCQWKLPIHLLCIPTTRSLVNYRTYKTTNRWCSVDACFNVLSIHHLLPSIIVFIRMGLYRLSFGMIETRPCGKAERHNNLALFTLTRLKMMYHGKRLIASGIYLFMDRYSHGTSYHSPIIYLELKLLVMLHTARESLTHSVLLFLPSLISPPFCCIDHHEHLFGLSLWLPRGPNQSGHIWHGAHIQLLWALRILDAIVLLYIGLIVCCAILFAVNWIIQVGIPV